MNCNERYCNLEGIIGLDKCILHCDKFGTSYEHIKRDLKGARFDRHFLEFLTKLALDYLQLPISNEVNKSVSDFISSGGHSELHESYISRLELMKIELNNINFLDDASHEGKPGYIKYFKPFKNLIFNRCSFSTVYSFEIIENANHFSGCEFRKEMHIRGIASRDTEYSLFNDCVFRKRVTIEAPRKGIHHSVFKGIYIDKLRVHRTEFQAPLFLSSNQSESLPDYSWINSIEFKDSKFKHSIDLSFSLIDRVEISSCHFEDDLVLRNIRNGDKSLKGNICLIWDSIFNGNVDLSKSVIGLFALESVTFEKSLSADNCKFVELDSYDNLPSRFVQSDKEVPPTTLRRVVAKDWVSFQSSLFLTGLEIAACIFSEKTNFLRVDTDFQSTSRETYRIIKNSFDKIGNHIEGNRYYSLEMSKYRQELKGRGLFDPDRLIFNLNYYTSNFGQSYLLPIFWLLVVTLIFTILSLGYSHNTLYIFIKSDSALAEFIVAGNYYASNILPLSRFLRPGMEMLSTIYYVLFSIFSWQTIVALRRHLRR